MRQTQNTCGQISRSPTCAATKKRVPDSSASVAGYEYQFLWAALRCLHLLAPNTKSTQVVIESLYGPDIESLQAEDEDLLVVDVSEYEGGETVDNATRLIVSQLKYSPTAPNKAWTIHSLCTGRSGNPRRSIIGGMGLIFQRFWNASKKTSQLPQRLRLSLVTNRPMQEDARFTIAEAQRLIAERKSPSLPSASWLLQQTSLSKSDKQRLAELREISGLTSTQFPTFLACLDMTGYGQPDLDWLDTLARKTLVEMGASWREDALQNLVSRVRKAAMRVAPSTFRADDVLTHFFCSRDQFLPAPNLVDTPRLVVQTRDAKELASCVRRCGRVLAHGAAGKGKSITVSQLGGYLPEHSHVFVYDCFALGRWEGSSHGHRHTSLRFCTQIVNELGVRFGTGLFFSPRYTAKQDRWTLTREALDRVCEQIPHGSFLVVVVDAADNARDRFNNSSNFDRDDLFLEELWKLPLPEKARLVVTCRTERRRDVCAPQEVDEFELLGFQPDESAALATGRLGSLGQNALTHFHNATQGTPRLQDYWISNELAILARSKREAQILARRTYGMKDEYRSWVKSASNALPSGVDHRECITMLRCMRQPFSVADFAGCMGLPETEARDFCLGLRIGLVLTDEDAIEFRDQDFAAILDESLSAQDLVDAHNRAAEWCRRNAGKHVYAALNMAFHIEKASLRRDLISRALDLSFVDSISSPDKRDLIATECVHLALRACQTEQDYAAPLQLAFSLAKLARGREAGKWLFLEYPEACIHNGLYPSVRKALLEADEANGSIHFRIASALAQEGDVETSRKHLAEGEAWLAKHIAAQGEHGMPAHVFNLANSAERGVAHALLVSFSAGAKAATCWVSEATRVEALHEFSAQLAGVSPDHIGPKFPGSLSDPIYHAALLAGAFRSHIVPEGKRGRECLNAVVDKSKLWRTAFEALPSWVTYFAEACLRCRADRQRVLSLLKKHPVQTRGLPASTISRSYWEQESHEYLRALALLRELQDEKLTVDDLFPAKKDASGYDYERERAKSVAGKVLPAYTFRAKALRSNWNAKRAWCEVQKSLEVWHSSSPRQGERYQPFFRTYALHIVDTLLLLPGNCPDSVDELLGRGKEVLYPTDFAKFCMDMAQTCARRNEYCGAAADLALRAVKIAREYPMKAREQGALLLRAGSLLQAADSALAAKLVGEALSVAQAVDEDAPHYAKALSKLALIAGERHEDRTQPVAQLLWKVLGALHLCAEDQEGIDWGPALEGVTALNRDLGYSAMWALDRTGTLPLPRAMVHYLQATACCHRESMPLHLVGVFFPLCEIDSSSVDILPGLLARLPDDQFSRDLFAALARSVTLNTQYERRESMCRKLLELASSKGLADEVKEMLGAQVEFYAQESNWQRHSYSSDHDTSSGRAAAIRALRSKLEKGAFAGEPAKAFNAVITSGAYGPDLRRLIVEQGQRQKGTEVVRYLDLLCALKDDGYHSWESTLASALCDLLTTLPQGPLVEGWIAKEYVRYVVRTYPSLVAYDSDYDNAAKTLLELGCVPAERRIQALLGILCEYGHRLPPRRLFELAGSLAGNSSACSPMSVLLSELDGLPGKAEDLAASNLPSEPVGLCSRMIHDAFAHADNRIRWRAFHSFRLAVIWGSGAFATAAVDLLHRKDCRLWMSARDWLLFALLYTSREFPSLLAPHASAIWEIATDESFPHAGHQELARRVLEHVVATVPSALDAAERASLASVNRPLSCLLDGDGDTVGMKKSFRFGFDSLDTMPYWYSRLGHAFGLHECDVAVRAEKWICDRWSLTDTKCREEEDHVSGSHDYGLTSHRHGGRPTVETYVRYVEWHAMMMAAGEMIKTLPAKVEHYSDGDESLWESWIGSHAFAADLAVLSDLRGPVPLDPVLHGARFGNDAVSRPLTVEDYRSAFRTSPDEFCVAGNYSAMAAGVSWRWDIDTALVSRRTARALGLAILGSWNPYAVEFSLFAISRISDLEQSCIDALAAGQYRADREMPLNLDPFQLQPWIVGCYSEEEIGSKDPMWRGSGRNWYALDRGVVQALGLQVSKLRNVYTDRDNRRVACCEVWNDEEIDSRYRDRDYSAGHRLLMLQSEVVRFLKRAGMDLIVRVTIHRNVEKRYGNDEAKYRDEAGVFILRSNGRLEAVGIRAGARGETDR